MRVTGNGPLCLYLSLKNRKKCKYILNKVWLETQLFLNWETVGAKVVRKHLAYLATPREVQF